MNHARSHTRPPAHTRTHSRTHARTYARTRARAATHTHTRTPARPHARTHAQTQTHTQTQTQTCLKQGASKPSTMNSRGHGNRHTRWLRRQHMARAFSDPRYTHLIGIATPPSSILMSPATIFCCTSLWLACLVCGCFGFALPERTWRDARATYVGFLRFACGFICFNVCNAFVAVSTLFSKTCVFRMMSCFI